MRILLANYRYFLSSGSERYLFNAARALEARGHEILPFSIRYRKNLPTPSDKYFVRPLGSADSIYFREHTSTPSTLLRTLERLFYSREVERAIGRMAADTAPDLAYVLNYLRKLSPALLVGLKRAGLPIVVRLSDYAVLCPEGHCSRNSQPCTLCMRGNLWPSIRYRCVQHSFAVSSLNALATWFHRYRRYFDLIDVFVMPSRFMYDKMREAGFAESRLRWIPSPVDTAACRPDPPGQRDSYIAYAGRIHPTKGLVVVLEALDLMRRNSPTRRLRFRIAGSGEARHVQALQRSIRERGLEEVVEVVGELEGPQLVEFLGRATLTILPSRMYENLPNALLESWACGTPVLASNLGSLADCVGEHSTAWLFQPGNATDLAERLTHFLDHPREIETAAIRVRTLAETTYAEEKHVSKLETLFHQLLSA